MELKINEKFRSVAPPLSDNELRLLKEDIMANGCRDPLVAWNGVIVDGHHRYDICREYGIPFDVVEKTFTGESEALVWIAKNQLGRRNLNAFQRCELVLPLEPALMEEANAHKKVAISFRKRTGDSLEGRRDTRDILAQMAGVSHTQLSRVEWILEVADEDTRNQVRKGEIKINTAYKRLTQEEKRTAVLPKVNEETVVPFRDDAEMNGETVIGRVRELLRKVTYGEADPETVIMELTRILEMMEGTNGKESV